MAKKKKAVVAKEGAEKSAPTPKTTKVTIISSANGPVIFKGLRLLPNVAQEVDAKLGAELIGKLSVWIKEV